MEFYVTRDKGSLSHGNDALQHHGILGMKWGIRRFQNKDGTLTEAGKKRYQEENDMLDELEYIEEHGQIAKTPKLSQNPTKKEAKDVLDYYNNDLLSMDHYDSERGRKAATLGLKAMDKIGEVDLKGHSPDEKVAQDAFLFDDWAYGYPQVADMIIRGKSADETKQAVKDIADAVFQADVDWRGDGWNIYYNLYDIANYGAEHYYQFIDACSDIYNSENKKRTKK